MELTAENYYSKEANLEYMSVSQFKDFVGTAGVRGCEAKAMAKLRGEWCEEPSEAMLVGSYVDAHVEGTLDAFKTKYHGQVYGAKGKTYVWVDKAENMIRRFERDPLFKMILTGEKQRIMTAELFGAKWKIKLDVLGVDFVCDLKTTAEISKSFWHADTGRLSIIDEWGYDVQGAIYPEVVRINQNAEKRLPMYFAIVSREKFPDICVVQLDDFKIRDALANVEKCMPNILRVKAGELEPTRCETCDYCKSTRVLTKPIWASELVQK